MESKCYLTELKASRQTTVAKKKVTNAVMFPGMRESELYVSSVFIPHV